jgi:hypothetical protein
MGNTFGGMLDQLCDVRDAKYRSDPERQEAIEATLVSVVMRMLESLRDLHDPS